jgi:chemotaxis protein histidine kinase CheA
MHELRLVAVSEDGSYAVLEVPGRGGRYSLQIDDRLRAVARGQFSRLAQYEIEVESPLRPKEIQERIRAGETADEIADAAGVPVERIRWFEGPVLAERAYRAQEAQSAMVRRAGDSGPGPRLGEVVTERLTALGTNAEDATWDSTKRSDGNWHVRLVFSTGGGSRTAGWVFDPRRKHATPTDDEAARLSLPEADLPPLPAPSGAARGEATVTQLQPRIAPSGQPARPVRRQAEAPAPLRHPEPSAPLRQPEPSAPLRHPEPSAPLRQPEPSAPVRQPEAPAALRQSEPSAPRQKAEPPAALQQPEAPAPRRKAEAAGRRRSEGSHRKPEQTAPKPPPQPAERAEQAPAPEQEAEQPAAAQAASAQAAAAQQAEAAPQQEQRGRRAASGRGRRSSVPSWDEIMFGSSRPRD